MAARHLTAAVLAVAIAGSATAGALDASVGRSLFQRNWISGPSSQTVSPTLGDSYDARACSACHQGAGPGRIEPPVIGAGFSLHLGDAAGRGDPTYGAQLHTRAVKGAPAEGHVSLSWRDGDSSRTLRPTLDQLSSGPLAKGIHLGLRRAPDLAGVQLLDSVPEAEILTTAARERPGGVAGRPSWVIDSHGTRRIGRWGWKAGRADLNDQIQASFAGDMGISRPVEPITIALSEYLHALPSPEPPPASPSGQAAFQRAGCGACHGQLRTADGRPLGAYTDLLLHDMGPGLDDGVGEGGALSREWRTAPLWSIAAHLRRGGLLHDGRARSVAEAVRWHGGQAAASRARFNALAGDQQRALAGFLGGW